MITVTPGPIDPNGFAEISHGRAQDTVITIKNDNGDEVEITVSPNTKVKWYPPAGWTEARFNGGNCPEIFRYIQASANEGG